MSWEFLGKGWQFPIEADAEGKIGVVADVENIDQAIRVVLTTAKGERVMKPGFGCGIHDLVFAVNSAGTRGRIASEVKSALLNWEPRISVSDVAVTADADEPNKLLINIDYKVKSTNSRFNMVYTFYLEKGNLL